MWENCKKLQNKALRMCLDVRDPREISVDALHDQCKICKLMVRRELALLGLMFDLRKDTDLTVVSDVNTRQADKIVFGNEIVHYNAYRQSPYYIGTLLWNRLTELQKSRTKLVFKNEVKKLYLTGIL